MHTEPLENLWSLLVSTLTDRLASGEASAQDLNIARQLLKDHGFNVDKTEESPIGTLNEILPFAVTKQEQPDPEAESA